MRAYPKEGSETPRALEGQIFSTLFSIAAWSHHNHNHQHNQLRITLMKRMVKMASMSGSSMMTAGCLSDLSPAFWGGFLNFSEGNGRGRVH